jgi:pyrophosphate--fructose-6-phosphate 1-phosphotransferase
MTLRHLSRLICNGIVRRAAVGKNHGVIVIPEGVLEFINEIQAFIIKLSTIVQSLQNIIDPMIWIFIPAFLFLRTNWST